MSKAGPYRVEVGPEVGGEAVDEEAENVQAVLGHLGEGRGQTGVLDCRDSEGFTLLGIRQFEGGIEVRTVWIQGW